MSDHSVHEKLSIDFDYENCELSNMEVLMDIKDSLGQCPRLKNVQMTMTLSANRTTDDDHMFFTIGLGHFADQKGFKFTMSMIWVDPETGMPCPRRNSHRERPGTRLNSNTSTDFSIVDGVVNAPNGHYRYATFMLHPEKCCDGCHAGKALNFERTPIEVPVLVTKTLQASDVLPGCRDPCQTPESMQTAVALNIPERPPSPVGVARTLIDLLRAEPSHADCAKTSTITAPGTTSTPPPAPNATCPATLSGNCEPRSTADHLCSTAYQGLDVLLTSIHSPILKSGRKKKKLKRARLVT